MYWKDVNMVQELMKDKDFIDKSKLKDLKQNQLDKSSKAFS